MYGDFIRFLPVGSPVHAIDTQVNVEKAHTHTQRQTF